MKVLVGFDTKHGATGEIAGKIAEGVRERGGEADLLDLRGRGSSKASLEGYDAVVVGGPTYMGRWSKRASSFAASREAELAGKELALFVVGNDADKKDEAAKAAIPSSVSSRARTAYFGGRLDFPKLSGFERFIIKKVTGKAESSSTLDLEGAKAFGANLAAGSGRRG